MAERVENLDVGVRWNSVDAAVMVVEDLGPVTLMLRPAHDDVDRRDVVITWQVHVAARAEHPNDEAIRGHPLYNSGLDGVVWIGQVHESRLIAELERRNEVHHEHYAYRWQSFRHWILPLKELVVEVVAEQMDIIRLDRSAAVATIART